MSLVLTAPGLSLARTAPLWFANATIGGHHVKVLRVRLDGVRIVTALGYDHVARTESLAHMAMRHHALAAIDGGFFDSGFAGPFKDLINTTVVNGHLVFKGDIGCTLFFNVQNVASMEELPLRIEGAFGDSFARPDGWYAYGINSYPEGVRSTITIFTPAWGRVTDLRGFQIQVRDGIVSRIASHSLPIPLDGYVIYVRGFHALRERFHVGRSIEYRVVRRNGLSLGAFADAWQAIGGGPRLLVNGHVALDPRAEGFHDPRLFRIVERSAVGVTRNGKMLILATAMGSLHTIARIMRRLGAYEAMNLDGGSSAGLWLRGRYITRPRRLLTNALLVLPSPH